MSAMMLWSSRQIMLEQASKTLTISTAGKNVLVSATRIKIARSGPGVIIILLFLYGVI